MISLPAGKVYLSEQADTEKGKNMDGFETTFQDNVMKDAEMEISVDDDNGLIVNILSDSGESVGMYLGRHQSLELARTLLAYGYGAL